MKTCVAVPLFSPSGVIATIVLEEPPLIEHPLLALILVIPLLLSDPPPFGAFSMLSRGNSNAGARLRRAKSASSVQTYRSTVNGSPSRDPALAYQQALTAASVAFEHANGRVVTKNSRELEAASSDDGDRVLKHRRSIRFTGPSAGPVYQRPLTKRSAADNKPSSQSQHSLREPSLRTSDSFVTALPEQSEEYVERRVSSLPSSYRKLRKTKSMVNNSKGSGLSLVSSFNKRAGHSRNHSLQRRDSDHRRNSIDSRLRKSLSFWRPPQDLPTQLVDQDKAVQLARDQYLRQLEEQRLQERQSTVDLRQTRKAAKPFKRTVRSSSTNSYGSAISSPTTPVASVDVGKSHAIGRKARNISLSLKTKLKKVFQKSSTVDDVVPAQHLNASRAHFGGYGSTFNGTQQRYDSHVPSPDTETIRRIDSRGQTFRDTSAFVGKTSHPASIRSIESDRSADNDTSRATSWADSTIANSVALLQSRDNKRLSTINEHGAPYQPSSSRQYGHLARNFAAQNGSFRDISAGSLYTRLRHEIEKNERITRRGEDENEKKHYNPREGTHIAELTPRGSSLNTNGHGLRLSKSVIFSPTTRDVSQQPHYPDNFHDNHADMSQRSVDAIRELPERTDSADSTPKRPLREVKSAFFPPNTRIERSSTSPYRQAMRSSIDESDASSQRLQMPNASKIAIGNSYQSDHLRVKDITDSDSIYSRTTSGNTPRASHSPSSESENEGGTAVVASRPLKYHHSLSPSNVRKPSSTQSSGDWQKFLSTEMAQLESQDESYTTGNKASSSARSPRSGHVRENAQIDDSDVEVGKSVFRDHVKQPVGLLQLQSPVNPLLSRQETANSAKGKYPLLEMGSPHGNIPQNRSAISPGEAPPRSQSRNRTKKDEDTPQFNQSLPSTMPLRQKASQASLTASSGNIANTRRYGMSLTPQRSSSQETLRTPSPRALKSTTTENSGGRYSAERAARLHRIQSSNSLESRRQQENRPFGGSGSAEKKRSPFAATSDSPEGSQLMIERFLTTRRKDMRISEENGDPVFL